MFREAHTVQAMGVWDVLLPKDFEIYVIEAAFWGTIMYNKGR